MVELVLNALDAELPPHCYVAMRVGDSQKIGRMSSERMYKFDSLGEHKYAMLDVFQRIGGCTVSIKSKDGDQDVNLNTKAGKMKFRLSSDAKDAKSAKKSKKEAHPNKAKIDSKFEAAKAYIAKHNLEERLKNAMKEVINDMPDDPVDFIAQNLRESDLNVPSDKPKQVLLEPEEVAPQPAVCDAKADGSLPNKEDKLREKTRQVLCSAAADGSLRNELKEEAAKRTMQTDDQPVVNELKEEAAKRTMQTDDQPVLKETETRSQDRIPMFSEVVVPPKALTEEEVEDFMLQIDDFREELLEEQIVRCKVAFSKFENKDDGTISTDCLGDALRKLGQSPTESALRGIMLELEVDHLGTITFPQFLSVVVDRIQDEQAAEELIPAFAIFDHSGDGFVSCSAIRRVMAGLGTEYTEEDVNDMIRKAGANGEGQVNYVEFANVMVLRM